MATNGSGSNNELTMDSVYIKTLKEYHEMWTREERLACYFPGCESGRVLNECGQSFRSMQEHMIQHTRIPIFQCQLCSAQFSLTSDHQDVHDTDVILIDLRKTMETQLVNGLHMCFRKVPSVPLTIGGTKKRKSGKGNNKQSKAAARKLLNSTISVTTTTVPGLDISISMNETVHQDNDGGGLLNQTIGATTTTASRQSVDLNSSMSIIGSHQQLSKPVSNRSRRTNSTSKDRRRNNKAVASSSQQQQQKPVVPPPTKFDYNGNRIGQTNLNNNNNIFIQDNNSNNNRQQQQFGQQQSVNNQKISQHLSSSTIIAGPPLFMMNPPPQQQQQQQQRMQSTTVVAATDGEKIEEKEQEAGAADVIVPEMDHTPFGDEVARFIVKVPSDCQLKCKLTTSTGIVGENTSMMSWCCGKEFIVTKGLEPSTLIGHVLRHFNRVIFECIICNRGVRDRAGHLQAEHPEVVVQNADAGAEDAVNSMYEDYSLDYQDDLILLFHQSFSILPKPTSAAPIMTKPPMIISPTTTPTKPISPSLMMIVGNNLSPPAQSSLVAAEAQTLNSSKFNPVQIDSPKALSSSSESTFGNSIDVTPFDALSAIKAPTKNGEIEVAKDHKNQNQARDDSEGTEVHGGQKKMLSNSSFSLTSEASEIEQSGQFDTQLTEMIKTAGKSKSQMKCHFKSSAKKGSGGPSAAAAKSTEEEYCGKVFKTPTFRNVQIHAIKHYPSSDLYACLLCPTKKALKFIDCHFEKTHAGVKLALGSNYVDNRLKSDQKLLANLLKCFPASQSSIPSTTTTTPARSKSTSPKLRNIAAAKTAAATTTSLIAGGESQSENLDSPSPPLSLKNISQQAPRGSPSTTAEDQQTEKQSTSPPIRVIIDSKSVSLIEEKSTSSVSPIRENREEKLNNKGREKPPSDSPEKENRTPMTTTASPSSPKTENLEETLTSPIQPHHLLPLASPMKEVHPAAETSILTETDSSKAAVSPEIEENLSDFSRMFTKTTSPTKKAIDSNPISPTKETVVLPAVSSVMKETLASQAVSPIKRESITSRAVSPTMKETITSQVVSPIMKETLALKPSVSLMNENPDEIGITSPIEGSQKEVSPISCIADALTVSPIKEAKTATFTRPNLPAKPEEFCRPSEPSSTSTTESSKPPLFESVLHNFRMQFDTKAGKIFECQWPAGCKVSYQRWGEKKVIQHLYKHAKKGMNRCVQCPGVEILCTPKQHLKDKHHFQQPGDQPKFVETVAERGSELAQMLIKCFGRYLSAPDDPMLSAPPKPHKRVRKQGDAKTKRSKNLNIINNNNNKIDDNNNNNIDTSMSVLDVTGMTEHDTTFDVTVNAGGMTEHSSLDVTVTAGGMTEHSLDVTTKSEMDAELAETQIDLDLTLQQPVCSNTFVVNPVVANDGKLLSEESKFIRPAQVKMPTAANSRRVQKLEVDFEDVIKSVVDRLLLIVCGATIQPPSIKPSSAPVIQKPTVNVSNHSDEQATEQHQTPSPLTPSLSSASIPSGEDYESSYTKPLSSMREPERVDDHPEIGYTEKRRDGSASETSAVAAGVCGNHINQSLLSPPLSEEENLIRTDGGKLVTDKQQGIENDENDQQLEEEIDETEEDDDEDEEYEVFPSDSYPPKQHPNLNGSLQQQQQPHQQQYHLPPPPGMMLPPPGMMFPPPALPPQLMMLNGSNHINNPLHHQQQQQSHLFFPPTPPPHLLDQTLMPPPPMSMNQFAAFNRQQAFNQFMQMNNNKNTINNNSSNQQQQQAFPSLQQFTQQFQAIDEFRIDEVEKTSTDGNNSLEQEETTGTDDATKTDAFIFESIQSISRSLTTTTTNADDHDATESSTPPDDSADHPDADSEGGSKAEDEEAQGAEERQQPGQEQEKEKEAEKQPMDPETFKQEQKTLYLRIRKIGKNRRMLDCRDEDCETSYKAGHGGSLNFDSLENHVLKEHMDRHGFQCDICNFPVYMYNTHHRSTHKKMDKRFTDLRIGFAREFLAAMEKYFVYPEAEKAAEEKEEKERKSSTSPSPTTSAKKTRRRPKDKNGKTIPRVKAEERMIKIYDALITHMIANFREGELLECGEYGCSTRYTDVTDLYGVETHILRHVGRNGYMCLSCNATVNNVGQHKKRKHKGEKDIKFKDLRPTFSTELINTFRDCFPDVNLPGVNWEGGKQGKPTMIMDDEYADEQMTDLPPLLSSDSSTPKPNKSSSSPTFSCADSSGCSSYQTMLMKLARRRGRFRCQNVICDGDKNAQFKAESEYDQHVQWHLNRPCYQCSNCSEYVFSVKKHYRTSHPTSPIQFRDLRPEYEADLIEMFNTCFNYSNVQPSAVIIPLSPLSVSSSSTNNSSNDNEQMQDKLESNSTNAENEHDDQNASAACSQNGNNRRKDGEEVAATVYEMISSSIGAEISSPEPEDLSDHLLQSSASQKRLPSTTGSAASMDSTSSPSTDSSSSGGGDKHNINDNNGVGGDCTTVIIGQNAAERATSALTSKLDLHRRRQTTIDHPSSSTLLMNDAESRRKDELRDQQLADRHRRKYPIDIERKKMAGNPSSRPRRGYSDYYYDDNGDRRRYGHKRPHGYYQDENDHYPPPQKRKVIIKESIHEFYQSYRMKKEQSANGKVAGSGSAPGAGQATAAAESRIYSSYRDILPPEVILGGGDSIVCQGSGSGGCRYQMFQYNPLKIHAHLLDAHLKRNGFECNHCGTKVANIKIHHIKNHKGQPEIWTDLRSDFPDLIRTEMDKCFPQIPLMDE